MSNAAADEEGRDPSQEQARSLPPKFVGRLLIGIGFGALVYLGIVLWADAGRMADALASFPLQLLLAAMGLSFLNYVVRFVRWRRYCTLLGIELDPRTSFLVHLAGLALTVTPGKMGEAFKSVLVRQVDGTPIHRSAPIVVAERFTDLLGFLILLGLGGIATHPEHVWVFWTTLGLCLLLLVLAGSPAVAGAAVRASRRLPLVWRLAERLEGAFESGRVLLRPRELVVPTLVSTVGWSLECVAFHLVASAFVEGGVPFAFAVYTYALAAIVGAVLIVFPGGLGVTEASMSGLLATRYAAAGVAAEAAAAKAASATLLIRLCTLWFAVAVGLTATALYARGRRRAH